MKQGAIAGPYVPNYPEVTDKLAGVKSFAARWVYNVLLTKFPIEEDWGDDPVWVFGIVRANKIDIAQESGVAYSCFNRYWSQLIEAELVSMRDDGSILIHFYKKKAYDAISATEVRERLSRNEAVIEELKKSIEKDPELTDPEHDKPQQFEEDHQQYVDDPPQIVDSSILLKVLKKKPLSREKLISWFYREIGQTKISGLEREKSRKIYRNLREDQFTVREIQFAAEWTVENANEKPRSFSLVSSMIGQAMEALKKAEINAKKAEEERRLLDQARADEEMQAEDRERIDALKDGMTPKKRENLREEAFRELKETPGMTERFIGEPLINAKENEIIRRALEEE